MIGGIDGGDDDLVEQGHGIEPKRGKPKGGERIRLCGEVNEEATGAHEQDQENNDGSDCLFRVEHGGGDHHGQ